MTVQGRRSGEYEASAEAWTGTACSDVGFIGQAMNFVSLNHTLSPVPRSWDGLDSAVRHEESAFPPTSNPPQNKIRGQRGREYKYEIKDTLILVSRPWVIDHPFTKSS